MKNFAPVATSAYSGSCDGLFLSNTNRWGQRHVDHGARRGSVASGARPREGDGGSVAFSIRMTQSCCHNCPWGRGFARASSPMRMLGCAEGLQHAAISPSSLRTANFTSSQGKVKVTQFRRRDTPHRVSRRRSRRQASSNQRGWALLQYVGRAGGPQETPHTDETARPQHSAVRVKLSPSPELPPAARPGHQRPQEPSPALSRMRELVH